MSALTRRLPSASEAAGTDPYSRGTVRRPTIAAVRARLPDVLAVIGVLALGYGVWRLAEWLAFVALGLACIAGAVYLATREARG